MEVTYVVAREVLQYIFFLNEERKVMLLDFLKSKLIKIMSKITAWVLMKMSEYSNSSS